MMIVVVSRGLRFLFQPGRTAEEAFERNNNPPPPLSHTEEGAVANTSLYLPLASSFQPSIHLRAP